MPLVKAKLIVYSAPYNDAQDIELMFNPQEISFTRSVGWDSDRGDRGKTLLPKVNFAGLDPYEFTLKNLLFDTYEQKTSVMDKYINNIKEGVTARPVVKARPPVYIFTWGERYFHCVITSLTYRLTMFLEDGTPVRAFVDIALREVDPQVSVMSNGSNAGSNAGSNTDISLFGDTASEIGNSILDGAAGPRPGGAAGSRPGGAAGSRPGGAAGSRPGGAGRPKPGGAAGPRPGGAGRPKPGGAAGSGKGKRRGK